MPQTGMINRRGRSDRDLEAHYDIRRQIGRRLEMVRVLLEPNRVDIAKEFGVAHQRWSQWEKGISTIKAGVLAEFCRRYSITTDWVLLGRIDTLSGMLVDLLHRRYGRELDELIWTPPDVGLRLPPAPPSAAGGTAPGEGPGPGGVPRTGRRRKRSSEPASVGGMEVSASVAVGDLA